MIYKDKLYGTLGVAKPVPYDFTQEEQDDIMRIGAAVGAYLCDL